MVSQRMMAGLGWRWHLLQWSTPAAVLSGLQHAGEKVQVMGLGCNYHYGVVMRRNTIASVRTCTATASLLALYRTLSSFWFFSGRKLSRKSIILAWWKCSPLHLQTSYWICSTQSFWPWMDCQRWHRLQAIHHCSHFFHPIEDQSPHIPCVCNA